MTKFRWWVLALSLSAAILLPALAWPQADTPANAQRLMVFISDLHFGLGMEDKEKWNPREDFRWSRALVSFLNAISIEGNARVDLVIAGDFLELWQFPQPRQSSGSEQAAGENLCSPDNPDLGCTVAQMEALAQAVVAAHEADLKVLGAFANLGDNRIYIVPGNHDAALLIDSVWAIVLPKMGAKEGRVIREASGVWSSKDGRIVSEHGHQIWPDVNLYSDWPTVTKNGRMIRPWGEYFVQRLYNLEEVEYPKIDNLAPSSAGVKYRMRARGILKNALDSWKFLRFSIFETSIQQKVSSLKPDSPEPVRQWDVEYARNSLGVDLIIEALAPDDPLRRELQASKDGAEADEAEALGHLLKDKEAVPDEEVEMLCDQLAIRTAQAGKGAVCQKPSLEYGLHKAGVVTRGRALTKHLTKRRSAFPNMEVFVYGHTHSWEMPYDFVVDPLYSVKIVNTGTFQRLISDEEFLKRASEKGQTPVQALQGNSLEDLAPCHSAVVISGRRGRYTVELRSWYENLTGEDRFVSPCDKACVKVKRQQCD